MRNFIHYMFCVIAALWLFWSLYNLARGRGVSHSVVMWLRVISLRVLQPLSAIVSSNSSRSIWSTFLTPSSPSAASENTTGLPIWDWGGMLLVLSMVSSSFIWWMEKVWCLQISLRLQVQVPWRHQFHVEHHHLRRQGFVLVSLWQPEHTRTMLKLLNDNTISIWPLQWWVIFTSSRAEIVAGT